MTRAKKGSQFERKICKQLSLWWTHNERDDIFWRTSQSGGRATQRKKTGQGTANQYGDIQATDWVGQSLISLCTIELKKGYSYHTFFDIMDKLDSETKQPYIKFIQQAMIQSKAAKTPYWILITSRDRKEPIIAIPRRLKKRIRGMGYCHPRILLKFFLPNNLYHQVLFITPLTEFLNNTDPESIRKIWASYEKNKTKKENRRKN